MSTAGSAPAAAERRASGRRRRDAVPRGSHAEWSPSPDRPEPVDLVTDQDGGRIDSLVPVRHGRMAQSPFAFFRGAAAVMAHDLAATPRSGIEAQLCGDAHLSNFGVFGSPERALVFDLNDFDETLPGPWEWDVKRLATSVSIAARHIGLDDAAQRELAQANVRSYREAMASFADMGYLELWYAHLRVDDIFAAFADQISKKQRKRRDEFVAKARRKGSLRARDKLAEEVDGEYRIASDPPLLVPLREFPIDLEPQRQREVIDRVLGDYVSTVSLGLGTLLARYRVRDLALKVVGVGSVGTRCFVVLLEGRDHDDPLFLQVKEAGPSVLEAHLRKSRFRHPGKRVVVGQRIMQATSDIFLGWTTSAIDGTGYYVRQLADMKGSVDVEGADAAMLSRYAQVCGWTLARAHARSSDPVEISGYLGESDRFDRAIGDFAARYTDQNQRDHDAFRAAIATGRVEATE